MARIRKKSSVRKYLLGDKVPIPEYMPPIQVQGIAQPPASINIDRMENMSADYSQALMDSVPTSGWNKFMSGLTPEAFMGLVGGKAGKNANQVLNIAKIAGKIAPKAGGVIGSLALPAAFATAVISDQIGIKKAKKKQQEEQAAWNAYYDSLRTSPYQGTLGFGQAYGGYVPRYAEGDEVDFSNMLLPGVEVVGERKKEKTSKDKLERLLYIMKLIDGLSYTNRYAYGDQVPIQAEKYNGQKEWIATPNNVMYPTNADTEHENQDDDEVSDMTEEGSKVFSARMDFTPSQLKAVINVLNSNGFQVNENLLKYAGKKGKTSPAKIAENIAKKYQKVTTPNSFDTGALNAMHKQKLITDTFKLNQILNGKYNKDTANAPTAMEQGTRQFAPGGVARNCGDAEITYISSELNKMSGDMSDVYNINRGCTDPSCRPVGSSGKIGTKVTVPCAPGGGGNNPSTPPKDDVCAKCVAEWVAKGTAEADARIICGCDWPKLKCPAGQRWSDQLQKCVPDESHCPPGQVWSDTLKTCVPKGLDSPCPPGYEDIGMGECVPILGSSADRSSMDKQCEDCIASYKKNFGLDDIKAREACAATCDTVQSDEFKSKAKLNANLLNFGVATAGNIAELIATRKQEMYKKAQLPDFVSSMPTEVPGKRQMQDRLLANAYPYMSSFMRSGPAGMANAQMIYSGTLDKIGEVALQMLPIDAQLQAARRQAQQQRAGAIFANDQQYNVDATALSNLKKKAPGMFLTKQAENSEKLINKLMDDRYRQAMVKILTEQAGLPNDYFGSIVNPNTGQLLLGTGYYGTQTKT